MKYLIITFFFCLSVNVLMGQVVADFENFQIPVDTFLDGKNANGGFESGNVILSNDYNAQFEAWTGFAISSETDNLIGGFANQYASIPGSGADNSQNYAVAYAFDPIVLHLTSDAIGGPLNSCAITNNTFAYYSMLNGDQFSKKFGGSNGDDPDFFKITMRAFFGGRLGTDSLEIFLADFRFQEDSLDYILDRWTEFDLSSLGPVDSLQISLSSSDVGGFGMNTPAYFCIDDIITKEKATSNTQLPFSRINIYPNPVRQTLFIDGDIQSMEIIDVHGRIVLFGGATTEINVAGLPPGNYFLRLRIEHNIQILPFTKSKE